ncbi:hypothetical protein CPB85DRAFT_1511687 [Mucidula mucida]|nr:hypothetical protein CPB85DRAFT_1511687 [Mucidula mucida]
MSTFLQWWKHDARPREGFQPESLLHFVVIDGRNHFLQLSSASINRGGGKFSGFKTGPRSVGELEVLGRSKCWGGQSIGEVEALGRSERWRARSIGKHWGARSVGELEVSASSKCWRACSAGREEERRTQDWLAGFVRMFRIRVGSTKVGIASLLNVRVSVPSNMWPKVTGIVT